MRFDIVQRYTARAFVHGITVDPSAKSVAELGEAMKASDWVSRQALTVNLQANGVAAPAVQLVAPSGDWLVQLGVEGYDVQYQQVFDSFGKLVPAPTFKQFLNEASSRLTSVIARRSQKAHRIAAAQEGLLANASPYELKDARTKLLKVPTAFGDIEPFEWDYRVAGRVTRTFGAQTETTNTLSSLKVAEVRVAANRPGDRLLLATDINTAPKNQDARFDGTDIAAFFEASAEWHADLFASTLALVGRSK